MAKESDTKDGKIVNANDNLISYQELLFQFLQHLPYYALILDCNRKIICSNRKFLADHDVPETGTLFNQGPGDVFQCENAEEAGCGNSPNCIFCGIYRTLEESRKNMAVVTNSCKLFARKDEFIKAYDFIARCSPVRTKNETVYLLTLSDVSAENRKQSLEKIFFHDVLNMVNGLKGLISYMYETNTQLEMNAHIEMLSSISDNLSEIICTQRDLMNAEKRELAVNFRQVSSKEIITTVVRNSLFEDQNTQNIIHVRDNNPGFSLYTDPVLLSRVLLNMVKNALEANNTKPGVTIICSQKNGFGVFSVHNHAFIEDGLAKCIFQPMFSTKGQNRGLGTYSMRLICENYLKGKVWFDTHPESGTTFTVELPVN